MLYRPRCFSWTSPVFAHQETRWSGAPNRKRSNLLCISLCLTKLLEISRLNSFSKKIRLVCFRALQWAIRQIIASTVHGQIYDMYFIHFTYFGGANMRSASVRSSRNLRTGTGGLIQSERLDWSGPRFGSVRTGPLGLFQCLSITEQFIS